MAAESYHLAIDLKNDEGRFVVGARSAHGINYIDVGSFKNNPIQVDGKLCWDIESIFDEIKNGIRRAGCMFGEKLESVGITSWGNDFSLLDEGGELLQDPLCYYEQDNHDLVEALEQSISSVRLFGLTACNGASHTSLYQLLALKHRQPDLFSRAKTFLTIPDILNYWLTGKLLADQTNASSTQLYKANEKTWATRLLEELGLPEGIFPEIIPPGSILGPIQDSLSKELNLSGGLSVVSPGCHDSACAIAATPYSGNHQVCLISGTWSIMGTVIKKPLVTKLVMESGFTNESSVEGGVNLLRVVRGHWALEQCLKVWEKEDGCAISLETISDMAFVGAPFSAVIDITDPCFESTGDMPLILEKYCKETGQPAPKCREDIVRIFMEGMALCYRKTVTNLEKLTNHSIDCLHVAGSGAKNHGLNSIMANALNRRVVAGPYSASALGNLMVQMIALGKIPSFEDGLELIRRSIPTVIFDPKSDEDWDVVEERLNQLKNKKSL